MILEKIESGPFVWYQFWCPGCERLHPLYTQNPKGPEWKFNGDMEKPTFSPSLLCSGSEPSRRCHLFVRNGQIEFCGDCHHSLAGKIVPMEDIEEEKT